MTPYISVHCISGDGKDIHAATETRHTCKLWKFCVLVKNSFVLLDSVSLYPGVRGIFFRSEAATEINRSVTTKKQPSGTQGSITHLDGEVLRLESLRSASLPFSTRN